MSKSDLAGLLLAVSELRAALERPCVQHPERPGKTYVNLPDDRQRAIREVILRAVHHESASLPAGVDLGLLELLDDLHQIPLWDADEPNRKIRKWLAKVRQVEAALAGQERPFDEVGPAESRFDTRGQYAGGEGGCDKHPDGPDETSNPPKVWWAGKPVPVESKVVLFSVIQHIWGPPTDQVFDAAKVWRKCGRKMKNGKTKPHDRWASAQARAINDLLGSIDVPFKVATSKDGREMWWEDVVQARNAS